MQQQRPSNAFDRRFGRGRDLDRAGRRAFRRGAQTAHAAILANYLRHRDPNQWIHFTNIGEWGNRVLDRASITEFIQYGNGITTAAYYHTFRDRRGARLRGSARRGYVMRFPRGGQPPAERFWSLTAYTPNAIELIPNPARKYLVARYTPGLQTNRNGSLSIYISRTKPRGVPTANWLPVSKRPFNLMLRVYGVESGSSVANNTYVPPPIVKEVARRGHGSTATGPPDRAPRSPIVASRTTEARYKERASLVPPLGLEPRTYRLPCDAAIRPRVALCAICGSDSALRSLDDPDLAWRRSGGLRR